MDSRAYSVSSTSPMETKRQKIARAKHDPVRPGSTQSGSSSSSITTTTATHNINNSTSGRGSGDVAVLVASPSRHLPRRQFQLRSKKIRMITRLHPHPAEIVLAAAAAAAFPQGVPVATAKVDQHVQVAQGGGETPAAVPPPPTEDGHPRTTPPLRSPSPISFTFSLQARSYSPLVVGQGVLNEASSSTDVTLAQTDHAAAFPTSNSCNKEDPVLVCGSSAIQPITPAPQCSHGMTNALLFLAIVLFMLIGTPCVCQLKMAVEQGLYASALFRLAHPSPLVQQLLDHPRGDEFFPSSPAAAALLHWLTPWLPERHFSYTAIHAHSSSSHRA